MTLTSQQLNQLVELYANSIVEDMDVKCLEQFVYDTICENMHHMGEEDVLNEIANVYDEDVIQELIAEVTN
jgi:hypothetical protein